MERQLEISCESYYDALEAYAGGADRIELNCALEIGGLTPSIATFLKIKEHTNLKVICKVRPRDGGFHYNEEEIETMMLDAEVLLDNGADGIAFGFLDQERDIDIVHTKKMISLIHSYGKTAVFHHAIDCVDDIDSAMNILITLGIDRILTSGFQSSAIKGQKMIAYLQNAYGENVEIMAGGNIDVKDVKKLIEHTSIYQMQCECRELMDSHDRKDIHNGDEYYNKPISVVSKNKVEEMMIELNK